MIRSADEFVQLRQSDIPEEYRRAAHDSAPDEVWLGVIERFPDMWKWVAHNKTIPTHVMELLLLRDPDADVRSTLAMKRSCPPLILDKLSRDADPAVRLRVALNPKVPLSVLEALLDDPWDRVVEVARSRLLDVR